MPVDGHDNAAARLSSHTRNRQTKQVDPAHPWTVASLASSCGMSRAAFARRFGDLVGEPPLSFLTGWRIALAADLLVGSDTTLGSVASQVGYGNAFALSAAFKRMRGISPTEYRRAAAS
jgi:AraC-like DNA-binding protein